MMMYAQFLCLIWFLLEVHFQTGHSYKINIYTILELMNLLHRNMFSPWEDFFVNPFGPDVISPNQLFLSQECFPQPNCVGSSFTVSSARECCAGTEEGMSYSENGTCTVTQCIVHGFASVSYTVVEAQQLTTTFGPNVKGNSPLGANIEGEIIAEEGTAQSTDFALRDTPVRLDSGFSEVRLDASNDDVTLEFGDTAILRLDPSVPNTVEMVEGQGQFLRDTSTVTILDNDLLNINFQESDYSFDEADNVSGISVRFRRTQSPFTLRLFPVNITEGKRRVGDFITIDETTSAATAGKDFTDIPSEVTIPASPDVNGIFEIPANFTNIADEQCFILVAEIGSDVPDSFVCFQRLTPGCLGRVGATEIKIMDNDDMVIGFAQRTQTVSERQGPANSDRFYIPLDVHAMIFSEKEFMVNFVLLRGDAVVQATNLVLELPDALFGISSAACLTDTRKLVIVSSILQPPLLAIIINDFIPENVEFFEIGIVIRSRDNFACRGDDSDGFFCRHTVFIVDDDEPYRVAFVETMYTVVESEGRVEVCVNLTYPEFDILDETVQVDVFHYDSSVYIPPNSVLATPDITDIFTRMYPILPTTDYEEQTRDINLIMDTKITAIRTIICYNQTIYNDMRLEVSEYIGLGLIADNTLSTILTEVEPMYDDSAILIIDDDTAVVGLERRLYIVSEDVGLVEVCAIVYSPTIDCPIAFPFDVGLSTSDNTAVAPMDYGAPSLILMFGSCETRSCVNVDIVDDLVDEPVELFRVTLNRTNGLDSRISLNPVDGQIEIIDNDELITVGYESLVYNTNETAGMVEICAIIYEPMSGGAPRDFVISSTTQDGSASVDYGSQSVNLTFLRGSMLECHNVSILQDDECEQPPEDFFADLAYVSGIQPININKPTTEVFINDSSEQECDIALSGVEQPLTVGQSATIRCMTNIHVPVSSIEWRDQSSTVLASATNQTVVKYTIPLVRDDLQGQQLTCRAVAGTIYNETVELRVAVPSGSLEVETEVSEDDPVEAGSEGLTLTCTVRETISGLTNMPSAHWMGPSGPVTSGEDIVVTQIVHDDTTATVTVTFSSLHTSRAGEYTCQGTVVTPAGMENATINSTVNVTVSLPTPTLDLSVPSGPLYEDTSQTLTCSVTLPDTVDTDVTVDVQWTPPASSDRVMISAVSSMRSPFISTLTLSPLSLSDAGQYSCEATADSSSQYITASTQGQSQVEPLTVTEHTNSTSSPTPTDTERIFPTPTAVSTPSPTSPSIVGLVAGVTVSVGVLILGVIVVTVFIICWKSQTDSKGKGTHCFTRKAKKDEETSPDRIEMSALPDDMSSTPNIYTARQSTLVQSTLMQSDLEQQLKQELSDKNMIISRKQVELSNVVGQGESGLVYRGYYDGSRGRELVAVKTCKALSTISEKEKLLKEMTTMLSFTHPNVMSLIGLCFDGEIPLLIMPFMASGNVLEFVKKNKEQLHLSQEAKEVEVKSARKVCLNMCHQISKGMEYLAEQKFVHRDLAARNCMMDGHGVIKVADFGLTEDTYGANYFRRRKSVTGSEEKVPIKWMAPESIENDIYNERTDVWPFGVTSWEIFTCGRVPYAGIPTMTLVGELCSGYRLDRPSNAACSDEIWDIVMSCWFEKSQQRPQFTTLVKDFSKLLDSETNYLKLSQN